MVSALMSSSSMTLSSISLSFYTPQLDFSPIPEEIFLVDAL
jgi:hypothetical protein